MTQQSATRATGPIGTWLGLIRGEYRESPGLCLTLTEARRFWDLDEVTSAALFATLVDAGFLTLTKTGAYVQADAH